MKIEDETGQVSLLIYFDWDFFWKEKFHWSNAAKGRQMDAQIKDHHLFSDLVGHVDGTHLDLAFKIWWW